MSSSAWMKSKRRPQTLPIHTDPFTLTHHDPKKSLQDAFLPNGEATLCKPRMMSFSSGRSCERADARDANARASYPKDFKGSSRISHDVHSSCLEQRIRASKPVEQRDPLHHTSADARRCLICSREISARPKAPVQTLQTQGCSTGCKVGTFSVCPGASHWANWASREEWHIHHLRE